LDAEAEHQIGLAAPVEIDMTEASGAVDENAGAQQVAEAAANRAHPVDAVHTRERDVALDAVDDLAALPVLAELDAADEAVVPPGINVADMHTAVEPAPRAPRCVEKAFTRPVGGRDRCPCCQSGHYGQCQQAAPPQCHAEVSPRLRYTLPHPYF